MIHLHPVIVPAPVTAISPAPIGAFLVHSVWSSGPAALAIALATAPPERSRFPFVELTYISAYNNNSNY